MRAASAPCRNIHFGSFNPIENRTVMDSQFVVSLDFELLWGVRDHLDRESYGGNVRIAREAIPRILDIFAGNEIRATWATVGFLFCESKDELIDSMPEERPSYVNSALSNYNYLGEVGQNEAADPYYFAPSLIERINATPGQEIGTHTLSHYYCLEDGSTLQTFEADLRAAKLVASRRGIDLRSIVFPRNQYTAEHLHVCAQLGLTAYRGNQVSWAYRAAKATGQTPIRRALRLVDAYTGLLGAHTYERSNTSPANVPASHFLRPCAGRLAPFHPGHIATIKRGMTAAANSGSGYHLWWHPHNFGSNLETNLDGLRVIIAHFCELRSAYGMASVAMVDAT